MGGSVVVGCYHTMLKEGRGGEGRGGEGVNIEDLYHIKLYPDYRYFIFPTWDRWRQIHKSLVQKKTISNFTRYIALALMQFLNEI